MIVQKPIVLATKWRLRNFPSHPLLVFVSNSTIKRRTRHPRNPMALWLYRYRLQLEIVIVKTSSVLGYRWHKFRYFFFFFFNPSYEGYSIPIQTDVSTFNGQTRNLFVRWIDLSLNVTRIRIENTRTRGLERRSERSNALWVRSKRKAVFARKEPGERRVEDN